jgi:hypothetical protein
MSRISRSLAAVLAFSLGIVFACAQNPTPVPQPGSTQPPAPIVQQPAPQQATPQQPAAPVPAAEGPIPPQQREIAPDEAAKPPKAESAAPKTGAKKGKEDSDKPILAADVKNPTLWQDSGDISQRDLFYGQGGKDHQPVAPFTFKSEDMNGTNPKFDVEDANKKKWRVKLGEEARPEVVASRLLWAVGYFANDDYLLQNAEVPNLKLKRGGNRVKDGRLPDARFSRKPGGQDKIAIWQWKDNPFTGKREFNGLRVMMAVMNSWDLKDINNAVYQDDKNDRQIFLMSDVGATFGTNGLSWTRARSKGNIDSFKDSKFIERQTETEVDFATPKPPKALLVETLGAGMKNYADRAGYEWIGRNIPREDARWMGSLLGQLTHQQLVDAFRAGNFPPDQIDAYVELVESRIQELKHL